MTTPLDRVRQVALQLPEAEEQRDGDQSAFVVAGSEFARWRDGQVMLLDADRSAWVGIDLAGDVDWALVEDRIAHGWELVAPQRLLEAGGR